MPYAGDDLSMVALLPTERDGMPGLEAALTPELWNSGIAALHERDVIVSFPKFTFDSAFKLAGPLQDMEMTDALDVDQADLRGIADPPIGNLSISDVLHKTFIDVNEEGTEAAGATAVVIGGNDALIDPPPPPKVFRADHPFLFALRDRHSGSLLFLGRVTDPGALAASAAEAVPEPAGWTFVVMIVISLSLRRGVPRA
jgi:serpin B